MPAPHTNPDSAAPPPADDTVHAAASSWTFLTNHAHVLVCLAQNPSARLRDVAVRVGITERAVQRIVTDLENGGVVGRVRDGRRNQYVLHPGVPLRHPIEAHETVGSLLRMVGVEVIMLPPVPPSPPLR